VTDRPFEGFGYCRVGQARARAAALCASTLSADARLLLLVLSEVQANGCCPMGQEVWLPALGVTADEAVALIKGLTDVGVLAEDSDVHCLHVHGRAIDKGNVRGRRLCGKAAATSSRRKARPKAQLPRPHAERAALPRAWRARLDGVSVSSSYVVGLTLRRSGRLRRPQP
jgi:hypothetical protein